jgi:hypothetical protein
MVLAMALLALLFSTHTASAYYDPGVQRWLNRDPIRELGFESLRAHYARRGTPTRGEAVNLFDFVNNSPIVNWDYLGLDNPGCDSPATRLPVLLPGSADCYLRCCAQHDACYAAHRPQPCTSKSWPLAVCPLSPCGHCNRQVLGCFASCALGGDGPDNPPYYCPNGPYAGNYYWSYSDVPASCWESGSKPPKPPGYPW